MATRAPRWPHEHRWRRRTYAGRHQALVRPLRAARQGTDGSWLDVAEFAGTVYDPRKNWSKWWLRFEILTFNRRRDLLQHYLDLNAGGTPHAPDELARVQRLRDAAAAGQG